MDKLKAILSMSTTDIHNIIIGEEKPPPTPTPTGDDNLTKLEPNNTNLHPSFFLSTSGRVPTPVVRPHEDKKPDDKRLGMNSGRQTALAASQFVKSSVRNWPRSHRLQISWCIMEIGLDRLDKTRG